MTWETRGRLSVGGRLAVNPTSRFPARRAASQPVRSLSCTELPVTGIISPRWEGIPPVVSLEVGLASEANHTHVPALKDQGRAGGQLSGRRISHQAVFLRSLWFNCSISEESARKQKATSSLFSRSGAICSFCPSRRVDTTVDRWAPSGCVHVTHRSYDSLCYS